MTTTTNETISPVLTTADLPTAPAEISILARELRAASKGAITHREAIERARAIVRARADHAASCAIRAINLAIAAPTQAQAERLTESAIRFLAVALKAA